MRNIFIALFALIITPTTAQGTCSPFYPSEEGKTFVIHQFDKRDRLSTIAEHTITDVTDNTIDFDMKLKDHRAKEIVSGEFKVTCRDGETILEPEALISPNLIQQYRNMEYTISGDGIKFPNTLEVGQNLSDGEIFMKVDAGIMNMSMTIIMADRKVERKEQVTTPAGTFDCYVITYTNRLEMGMAQTNYSTQWVASGIGMVKEETRKQNGRLVSKSVLQEIR